MTDDPAAELIPGGAGSLRRRLRTTGDRSWPRLFEPHRFHLPIVLMTGAAALLVSLGRLAQYTDAPAVFANALACVWLTLALASTLVGRQLGMPRWMVLAWIFLGLLRACVALWGVPQGWSLAQTIEAQGRSATSQTHAAELGFSAGRVPAHLINDREHFNFRGDRDNEPKRAELPVAVKATGFVAGQGVLVISASSPVRITVGTEVTELRPPIAEFQRGVSVSKEERVEIAMEPTSVDKAALRVQAVGLTVYSEPTAGDWMTARRLLGAASTSLDALVFLGTFWALLRLLRRRVSGLDREHAWVAGLTGLVIIFSTMPQLLTWLFQHDSLIVLSGGDDWLTYEGFARDIRGNSLLMLGDKPIGEGQPFYYQALYPYAIALGHLVLGESVQGVVLVQLGGVAAVIGLAFRAMPKEAIPAIALAVVLLGTGIAHEWSLQAGSLLSENLLILIFALLLLVVSRLRSVPSLRSYVIIGLLVGIGNITRSTVWLAVPFLLVVLCRGVSRPRLLPTLGAILVPMMLVASLIPLRNLVVSGNPAWLPTNGSVTLEMGNVPPGRKIQTEPWLGLSKTYDPSLIAVAEAAVNAPQEVATKMVDKAVYVLGFPKSMDTDHPWVFWPVLSLWLLAPLGILTRSHTQLEWVCLVLALTHVLALVIVHPHYYFYRLEMPATLPLAIWDAVALARVAEGLPDASWLGKQVKQLLPSWAPGA